MTSLNKIFGKEIQGDADVESIFLGLYSFGMKPREIMQEFNMPSREYNNGMRRLKTVLARTTLHFNKNIPSV